MNVMVIAEIGVNHNGNIETAHLLIDRAVEAGADAVKFQTFRAELLATPVALKARYQGGAAGGNQLDLLRHLELTEEDHRQLFGHSSQRGVEFMSTGFHESAVDFLVGLGIKRIKVPSGEITNLPFLRHVGAKKLPILLSTGMANLGEIEAAIDALNSGGLSREMITVLHCTSEYPAPLEEVNLMAMESIRQAFCVDVGYSDHTLGSDVAIAAVSLGAVVIEKHITLDCTMAGPDHSASMEPDKFAEMVKSIRAVELALGSRIKRAGTRERLNLPVARKSLVARKPIKAGESYSGENLTAKRPGTGVSPMMWDQFIGRTASRNYAKDEPVEW